MAPELVDRFRVDDSVRRNDGIARALFMVGGLSVFGVLGFIVWVLLSNSLLFFSEVSLLEFFTATTWDTVKPVSSSEPAAWGVLPLITGTLVIAVGAAIIGVPIGLGTAIYLAEYASPRLRAIVKPVLELLAGIPSIVFGFFALIVISPIIHDLTAPGTLGYRIFGAQAATFSALNAIIVVGIMVIPIVTSLSEDALRAVPRHLREASLGLGATRWETTSKVVLPAALSGITASFVLGISRAIGETMAVTLAAGAGTFSDLEWNPVNPMLTMTSFIANRMSGDTPRGGPEFHSLFAVGLTLFAMTLIMNVLARRFVKRFREEDTT